MHTVTQKLASALGLLTVLCVLLPPLSGAAQELFSLHMAQHLLLIAVAAPLLAWGSLFPSWLPRPLYSWLTFVSVFLFWHWPTAFQWAAQHEATELLELLSILLAALLFWDAAFHSRHLSYGARALYVVTAGVATDLPGVIMIFSPSVICTMPGENALHFGIDPLTDQHIAGLLMWVPANLIFFAIATALFARWLSPPSSQVSTYPEVL